MTAGDDGRAAATAARSEALVWAADHLDHWSAHMTTRDQRRVASWLSNQVRMEAVRVRDGLPDTDEGRRAASARLAGEQRG